MLVWNEQYHDLEAMDTKDFDVIRIARSDGADTGPGYWPVTPATPAAANVAKKPGKEATVADKTPRTKPQMARLAEDDPRFVEWRIKLGILLKQELSPNPDGKIRTQATTSMMPLGHNLMMFFLYRRKSVVCALSTRLLAI